MHFRTDPVLRALEPDLVDATSDAAKMLFDGAHAAANLARDFPLFRPTFDRNIPHRLAADVVRSRLLPLAGEIARRKVELRAKRTSALPEQIDEFVARIEAVGKDVDDPNALFEGVTDLSLRLERMLRDVDYITFGQVGLVGQLRALSVTLRTSRAMWTAVRSGYAFREPAMQRRGMRVLARAESALAKAGRGIDISADLNRLEDDYTALVTELEAETGSELHLPDHRAFAVVRRAWGYRQRLESEINERNGTNGPITNRALLEDVQANGLPPKMIAEEIDAHVLPALRRLIDDIEGQRGALPDKIRKKANALEAELIALRDDPSVDVDDLELRIIRSQKTLSSLLEDVEKLVKPIDGPARRIRAANEALLGLRGLFVTLRMINALEDPEMTTGIRSIADDANAILTGSIPTHELPAALTKLEERIDRLDADLTRRLHVEHVPAINEVRKALGALRRIVRLRIATQAALNPAIRKAIDAIKTPQMTPEERGPIFDEAMQEPLLEATVGLAVALRELDLGFTFADAGASLERMLRAKDGNEISAAVARSPLAFLANAEFEKALARFDKFIDNVDTPEGRCFIDRSLNILRAVYEVEHDQIAQFTAVVPESEQVRVATAMTEYTVRASLIMVEWIAAQLADPGGEAVADFLDLMVDTSADRIDEFGKHMDPDAVTSADVTAARKQIRGEAKGHAKRAGVRRIGDIGTRLSDGPGGPYAERLRTERTRLEKTLEVVETTPESQAAVKHVLADLNAAVKMAVNLVQLFGAASNPMMEDAERERVIQTSVERMGPMFIKVMQSLVNMEGLIRAAAPDAISADDDPVIRSLAKLQDEVTPLPWPAIEDRIRTSLGIPADMPTEDNGTTRGRFVAIEKKSLKSGSIGQLHRAKIRVTDEDGERVVDCVVKVLRPGVEEAFENTVRATRLTLSLVGELLRLDDAGEIFGDIKADAEARLPLIERALNGFIESFRVETDFGQEVDNLRAFEKMYRADPYIIVPAVFDSHTADGVLTMEELKGFKLSSWTDRYRAAAAAPTLAEEQGPVSAADAPDRARVWAEQTLGVSAATTQVLRRGRRFVEVGISGIDHVGHPIEERVRVRTPSGRIHTANISGGPSQLAAEHKAKLFAAKAFGLSVTSVRSFDVGDNYRCRVQFDDKMQTSAEISVSKSSGRASSPNPLPSLTNRGAEALRDRLRMAFMVQTLRGLLHGDPHEGNFFVMPDGKTIGLIDFGLALDVGLMDAKGPLALMAGAILQDPRQMAEAVLDLSTGRDLEGDARDAALAPLITFFDGLSKEADAAQPKRRGPIGWIKRRFNGAMQVVGRSLEAIQDAGLVPLPRVIHSLKAIFAMSGNIAKLAPFDERPPSTLRKLGLLSRSWIIRAISPFMGKNASAAKRRRLERHTSLDVPRFAQARAPPEVAAAPDRVAVNANG